ncbi:hypothetical protein [Dictyobacter kobayashii]|uniref:Uncharacterized protein n=1 Tax=Dictyobacter kobayashii TaxID=2014872 RepID=A0A402AIN6_9CHLR|nr:hypothetical protein [Dictyobacter kobayashii]GCE18966.1 hypothetical protein KDK_27660 [Dictyobacter kobayashii]
MKKKEDIHDYCTAGDAAQVLSEKLGRPILPNYICKMAKSRKRVIRTVRIGRNLLYHRFDIADSLIKKKNTLHVEQVTASTVSL